MTCAVEGCTQPARSRSWCEAHYTRWRRTGSTGGPAVWDRKPGTCSVDRCTSVARSLGMCNAHHLRWSRHSDTSACKPRSGPGSPRWVPDERLTYDAMHDRVKRAKGAPSEHRCRCGAVAEDWAYDHVDPTEIVCPVRGLPMGTDVDHYRAMCRSCHKAFDWQHRRAEATS